MLAEATRAIAARAARTTLLARRPETLAAETGAAYQRIDWADPGAAAALDALPPADLLLSWLHDDAVHLARPLEDRCRPGARVIRVHGAASRDPATRAARDPDPRPDLRRQTVILGWAAGPRWLSDAEISAAAVEALVNPDKETVVAGILTGPEPA
ncbi:MAG: hypothetical protein AAFW69_04045, partial [Pseudomonadota bacterium]